MKSDSRGKAAIEQGWLRTLNIAELEGEPMTILGKYCKAFPLHQLRQFPGWTEKPDNARIIRREVDGLCVEVTRQLTDAHYVYLQRNFTVTDGIFIDENVIFSDVTPEWIEYCQSVLGLHSGSHAGPTALVET